MNTPFKVGKTYKTRGGWDATVISHKGITKYPLIVHHKKGDDERADYHAPNGAYSRNSSEHGHDLIAPEKPKKRVPLTAADVPAGSVLRNLGGDGFQKTTDGEWTAITEVMAQGIRIPMATFGIGTPVLLDVKWARLQKSFEIKRPGEDWKPCWREIEEGS